MDIISLVFFFIMGISIGSFLNVLSDRLPADESIMGRSHCDYCKKTLEPIDLIPIVSFLFLRGRCRRCKKKLSFQYPLVEILTGVAFVLTWLYLPEAPVWHLLSPLSSKPVAGALLPDYLLIPIKIGYLSIISCLMAIFVADLKYKIIPDQLQIALFVSILVVRLIEMFIIGFTPINVLINYLGASVAVMLPILAIYLATKGKGMGFGDVKFALSMGLLLGIKGGLIALYIAFITGAIGGVALIALRRSRLKSKIAFGPFLIIGTVLILFLREFIFNFIAKIYSV